MSSSTSTSTQKEGIAGKENQNLPRFNNGKHLFNRMEKRSVLAQKSVNSNEVNKHIYKPPPPAVGSVFCRLKK